MTPGGVFALVSPHPSALENPATKVGTSGSWYFLMRLPVSNPTACFGHLHDTCHLNGPPDVTQSLLECDRDP